MFGEVCVREDLFNGFSSKESADQRIASGGEDGEARRRTDKLLSDMGSSIAGLSTRHALFAACVHVPRCVARAARKKASNNRRWRGCRSKRNSGCHWIPRKKRWAGDSIASTIPSGAKAMAINDGATALND